MQAAACTNQSVLRQIMGHTHIRTTDRYIHPTAAAHIEAVERVSRLVGQALAASAGS